MALLNFKDIDFSTEKAINKTINFKGNTIEVVPYLSASDKYDLVMITLQKSFEKNIYNPFKMDLFFDLNVVYLYTNIVFNTEDRVDELELYDTLKNSGLIDLVKAEISAEELQLLKNYVLQLAEVIIKYRNTFGAVLGGFIDQLPSNMEQAVNIMEKIDFEKYKGLLEMASQLNLNLKTEEPIQE